MSKFRFGLVICLIALSVSACSKKKSGGEGTSEGTGLSDQDIALQNQRFGEGTIPKAAEGGLFKDIQFEFNSSSVSPEDLPDLENHAKTLRSDPSLRVDLEGHCDRRGTTEYNMVLGQKRAKAVASLLTKYGASSSQMGIVSYGEEIPLDPSDSEEAYAKNRRVHFAVYKK